MVSCALITKSILVINQENVSMTDSRFSESKKPVESSIPCFRCGVCCSVYQGNLNRAEGQHIADWLGLAWEEFLNEYTDKRWPGVRNFLLRQSNGACVFLERGECSRMTRCLIHPVRPLSCRDWLPGWHQRECRDGLARHWGLAVNPSGQLAGSAQQIQEFRHFLESLEV